MGESKPRPIRIAWWLSLLQIILVRYVRVEAAWVEAVRVAATRGPVCFVLRNRSLIDFLCLRGLLLRYDLPPLRFVSGLSGMSYLPVIGKLISLFRTRSPEQLTAEMRDALQSGGAAAVFLRRPAIRRTVGSRPVREDGILAAASAQAFLKDPIQALPTVFLWGESAMHRMPGTMDFLFGSNEYPRLLRSIRLLLGRRSVHRIFAAAPIDVAAVRAGRRTGDAAAAATLRAGVGRHIEIVRRAELGSLTKPSSRIAVETLRSPRLRKRLSAVAEQEGIPASEIVPRAWGIIRRMAADFKPAVVSVFATVMALLWRRLYTGIDIREEDTTRIRCAVAEGACLLLPSHKSHSDYLLMSHLFREHNLMLPHIAAGQNLAFWPMGFLFRSAGAFFIRRRFVHDRFYTAIVSAYVRRLISEGYTVEVFIEGGRSRTGKLLRPKIGMLEMALQAIALSPKVALTVQPVCIGYEHVIEEKAYAAESKGAVKKPESIKGLLQTTTVLFRRYGRVYVRAGVPFTVDTLLKEKGLSRASLQNDSTRRTFAASLGMRTLFEINRVTVVGASSILSLVLLSRKSESVTHSALKSECRFWVGFFNAAGVEVSSTTRNWLDEEQGDRSLDRVIRAFASAGRMNRVKGKGEPRYGLKDGKRDTLDYYKNNILHFLVPASLTAAACLNADGPIEADEIAEKRALGFTLYRREFILDPNGGNERSEALDNTSDRTVSMLANLGILAVDGSRIRIADRTSALRLREVLREYHEAYFAGITTARQEVLRAPKESLPSVRSKLLRRSVQSTLKDLKLHRPAAGETPYADGALGDKLYRFLRECLNEEPMSREAKGQP